MIGGGLAYFFFNSFTLDEVEGNYYNVASAFQVGAFTNRDNADRVADRNNGIVVLDKDIYRVYVAILNDKEAINKMKDYYKEIGLNYYLKEINVSSEFLLSISDSEELLKRSSKDTYNTINVSVLNKYKEML